MGKRRPAKERICEALLDLMETHPFESITVTDIVDRAGVSRTIFYRNFDSIFAVLQEIEDRYVEHFPAERLASVAFFDMSERANVNGPYATDEYAGFISDSLRMVRILTGPNGDPSFEPRMRNRCMRINRQTLEARLGASDSSTELMATYIAGAQMNALKWWAAHEREVDAAKTSRLIGAMNANIMRAITDAEMHQNIDIRAK